MGTGLGSNVHSSERPHLLQRWDDLSRAYLEDLFARTSQGTQRKESQQNLRVATGMQGVREAY